MFTERSADKVQDALTARSLVLRQEKQTVVFCVVDTCMMARDLIDKAKELAAAKTGIPTDRMLVSATHTHSAPSAMGCLGSRIDPEYAAMLPGKIADGIAAAVANLQPAKVGWAKVDDWDHTHNRRWIRRPDRMLADPFGVVNVRANMHPGHRSADAVGPSGPVDPALTLLGVKTRDGKPLAVLANYSMHYYGSPLLSADYFGRFAAHFGKMLDAGSEFVGIMSQGTSGDLGPNNYAAAKDEPLGHDAYGREVAQRALAAWNAMVWHDVAPLEMAESTLNLNYRTPSAERLEQSRKVASGLGERLPQNHREIYALEAIYLHERQQTELKLQAVRVGELGIAALPNEVYALTGLKLKAQSPFPLTMNVELANGAEGYIPPPEQHELGGYTTWPARTAGLEVPAEPKIVESLLTLLEKVSGKPRRAVAACSSAYVDAVKKSAPTAHWSMDEMQGRSVADQLGKQAGELQQGVALYLPGFDEGRPPQSRALHFAGGRMKTTVKPGAQYSVEFWLWNGLPATSRAVAGYAYSRGPDGDAKAPGEHLGIGGTYAAAATGRLILFNGNDANQLLIGKSVVPEKSWQHVVFIREGESVRVHLNGNADPDVAGKLPLPAIAENAPVFFGGRTDQLFNWEGKLDEVAFYDRVLTTAEIQAHVTASGRTPEVVRVEFPPLSPADGIKSIHVPDGYKVDCVAHEPQTMDPVAIDWDLSGKLWVVEIADYPLGMDGNGKAGGRIRVLEDADQDGRYEKATLFAEGLNFPTGLLTWRGGVLVTAAPEVLFLKDTDGDGKADVRDVILTGLSEGNQQLRANGLRWGLDHWIYCAAGGHHGDHAKDTKLKSAKTGAEVVVGSRDFRFRPDTGEIEPESGPSQFGRNRDDWGHWFGTQNSKALWHYVFDDRSLRRNPHVPAPDPTNLIVRPLNAPVWPLSPREKRYHSFENAGHYTSACSGMIYRDTLLFGKGSGEMHAFTCEPFHNLVQRNVLIEEGVSFAAKRAAGEEKRDFFVSEDRWCRPVMTRTGPDGALWVVDMYRYMIEHPHWLPEEGRAELLPFYRRGDDKGRIYRVLPKNATAGAVKIPNTAGASSLLSALHTQNGWWRDKVHMALFWHLSDLAGQDRTDVVSQLKAALERGPDPVVAVHLLHLLREFGGLDASLVDVCWNSEEPRLREALVRLAPTLALRASADPDIKTRFQAALALGELPNTDGSEISDAVARLATSGGTDSAMRSALMTSAAAHFEAFCLGLARCQPEVIADFMKDVILTAAGQKKMDLLQPLLKSVLQMPNGGYQPAQWGTLAGFLRAIRQTQPESLPAWLEKARPALGDAFRVIGLGQEKPALRIAAAELLLEDQTKASVAVKNLESWLVDGTDAPDLQIGAIKVLAAAGHAVLPVQMVQNLDRFGPRARRGALEALLSRPPWSLALLRHIEAGNPVLLEASQRSRLLHHGTPDVKKLAEAVFATKQNRKEVMAHFSAALKLTGDATRGSQIFATRCVACHKTGNLGFEIGPNLISVRDHPSEKLLLNILDPTADVQPGFYAYRAMLKDGSEVFGLVTAETSNSVSIKLLDGSIRLLSRAEITGLKSAGISLRPEGLEAGMSLQDMADVISHLQAPKP
jgi:putative membrane-bound dehydrogenase-like protein